MARSLWVQVHGEEVRQGDYLPGMWVVRQDDDFDPDAERPLAWFVHADLLVMTHNCDLEHDRVTMVCTCICCTWAEYCEAHPELSEPRYAGYRGQIERGRIAHLRALPSPEDPSAPDTAVIVDFSEVYGVPVGYLRRQASKLGPRWRLADSEAVAQEFGRYFFRHTLPPVR